MEAGRQRRLLVSMAIAVALAAGCGAHAPADRSPTPTIVFVVLDTVRADHLSLCGYERPTSPELQALANRDNSVSTCRAYAPGDWTLPSHASFFTGRAVTDHGARIATEGPVLADIRVAPLAGSWTTLAEHLGERGYRTVAVSANPVLGEGSGLLQGFAESLVAEDFNTLPGRALVNEVETLLGQAAETSEPLFLFVNIADAHGPWHRVPETVDWLPERTHMSLSLSYDDSPYRRYVRGELDPETTVHAREHYRDVYDWGIYRADRTLGQLLRALTRGGWLDGHHRVVVTSDHGEFLAERGLVGHGGYLHEANNRVPVVFFDSERRPEPLVAPLSGLAPFYLARDGRFTDREPPVAVAFPNVRMRELVGSDVGRYDQTSVGLWREEQKWLWSNGELTRIDLVVDPEESSPHPLEPTEIPARLDREIAALAEMSSRSVEANEALLERLRALGYVD